MTQLTPFALKDAPALIEAVFPAQKVSFEAQREKLDRGRHSLLWALIGKVGSHLFWFVP